MNNFHHFNFERYWTFLIVVIAVFSMAATKQNLPRENTEHFEYSWPSIFPIKFETLIKKAVRKRCQNHFCTVQILGQWEAYTYDGSLTSHKNSEKSNKQILIKKHNFWAQFYLFRSSFCPEFPIKSNTKYFTKSVCVLLCWHKKQKQELVLSWSSYGSFCSPICPLLPQIQVNAKANFLSKEIGSSHALLPAETKIWKSKQTDFKANKKGLFLGPFYPILL